MILQLSPEESASLPFITAAQMREVDRLMVEEYGITLLQMMEHAGRLLARLARTRFLEGNPRGRRVLVLAGIGGNGGGGLVCARWLHNWGASVEVWLSAERARLAEAPHHQLLILEKLGIPVHLAEADVTLPSAALLVDALLGYSLKGNPLGAAASLVQAANRHEAPVLALDLPTGVDATNGEVHEPTIRAAATLTLALPKTGLRAATARPHIGELFLGDIGVPPGLYTRPELLLDVGHIFAVDDLVRLW